MIGRLSVELKVGGVRDYEMNERREAVRVFFTNEGSEGRQREAILGDSSVCG